MGCERVRVVIDQMPLYRFTFDRFADREVL